MYFSGSELLKVTDERGSGRNLSWKARMQDVDASYDEFLIKYLLFLDRIDGKVSTRCNIPLPLMKSKKCEDHGCLKRKLCRELKLLSKVFGWLITS